MKKIAKGWTIAGLSLVFCTAVGYAQEKNLIREPGFGNGVGTDDGCAWRSYTTENLDGFDSYSLWAAAGTLHIAFPNAAKGTCWLMNTISLDVGQEYVMAFKVAAEKPGTASTIYTQEFQPWKNAGLSKRFTVKGAEPVVLHAWFKVNENTGRRSLRFGFDAGLGEVRFSEPRLHAVTADNRAALEKLYPPTESEKKLARAEKDASPAAPRRQATGNLLRSPIGGAGWRIVPATALSTHGDYQAEPSGSAIKLYLPEVQGGAECGIWYDVEVEPRQEYVVSVNVLCENAGELNINYTQDGQPWRGIWNKMFKLVPGVNRLHGYFTDKVGIKRGDGIHSLRFTLKKLTGEVQLSDPVLMAVTGSKEELERKLKQQEIPGSRFALLRVPDDAADAGVLDELLRAEELSKAEQADWRRQREATNAFKTEQLGAPDAPVTPSAPVYERLLQTPLPGAYEAMSRLRLGQAYLLEGRAADAAEQFAKLPAIELAPEEMRAVGRELLKLADGGQAAVAPRAIFEGLVEDPAVRGSERRKACVQLGHALLREGRTDEALVAFDRAMKMPGLGAKDRLDLLLIVAHTLRAQGNYATARTMYGKLLDEADAPVIYTVIAHWSIADAYAIEKNIDAARAELEKVAALLLEPKALLLSRHLAEETRLRLEELTGDGPGYPDFRTPIPALPKPAVEFFVSPDGDDANPGTREKPFATLTRARDAVRAARQDGPLPTGGATVYLRGGEYVVANTFELTAQDGGTAEAPVVYRPYRSETVTLYGGKRLTGLEPVTDAAILARLPEESRGQVLQVDLKANGVTDFGPLASYGMGYARRIHTEVFWNGEALSWARWPNEGYVKTVAKIAPQAYKSTQGPAVFESDADCAARAARWGQARDIMLYGFWDWTYWASAMGPATLDLSQNRFSGPVPCGGFMDHNVGHKTRFYVFNLLEEIDRPGECYLDRATGMFYVHPPSDPARAAVEISLLNVPFVTIEDGSHVVLQGLRFDCGRHSAIRIEGGANNLVAGCTVTRMAWDGITASGGRSHGIFGCDVNRIGAVPVSMSGGNELTLEPGGHFIENCHIRDFARIERGATKVSISGVGNRCVHNRIHGPPSQAVGIGGNDQLVAFNEVYDACREMDDMGVIDCGFDTPFMRGIRVMYNIVRDAGGGGHGVGTFGIRLDDCQSGVLIRGNVLYRCAQGMGAVNIHGGKDNIVDNNLFVECGTAIGHCPWGQANWEKRLKRESIVKNLKERKIDQPPYSTRYPELATLRENADRNYMWRNLIVRCDLPFSLRGTSANQIVDNLVLTEDPGFADAANADFWIKPDSEVFVGSSFRRIPFERIGLYEHELRASWPVVQGE